MLSPDPVRIRAASSEDESAVVALWRICGLVASYNDPAEDFRFAREGVASDVLIAEDGEDRIVGAVMVGHDGHRGWLYYVASDPARRGEGIGRALVEAAEAWLAERSIRKAMLMVRPTNAGVIDFYERLGFESVPNTVMQRWLEGDQT